MERLTEVSQCVLENELEYFRKFIGPLSYGFSDKSQRVVVIFKNYLACEPITGAQESHCVEVSTQKITRPAFCSSHNLTRHLSYSVSAAYSAEQISLLTMLSWQSYTASSDDQRFAIRRSHAASDAKLCTALWFCNPNVFVHGACWQGYLLRLMTSHLCLGGGTWTSCFVHPSSDKSRLVSGGGYFPRYSESIHSLRRAV